MEESSLASLSLTHVRYNPDDPVSYLSAWLALVPQALCVIYVSLIWASREVEILLMFAGQMGCEALNFLLKRWIREERPRQMYGKGYGMPSSHSQFVTFFSMSLTFFLLFRHSPQPSATHLPSSLMERATLSCVACLCAAAVAGSRVYLNYHTPKQVLVGCAAGAVSATVWFLFTSYLRQAGWIEWALDTSYARLVRLRDLILDEDLADAGWERWETRRKQRRDENGSASKKVR